MSTLPGRWALTIQTPIGRIQAEMTFTDHGGVLAGTAVGASETLPLRDIRAVETDEGERVTWEQTIIKPMRLTLAFDVTLDGDTMQGHSRAGRLPRSRVTGTRLEG